MGENFQAIVEWLGQYGYPILFLLVFAESAGLPLPGETAVLAAAILASRPDAHMAIQWVIVVVIVAAVLGDNLGFLAGHYWARPRLRSGKRFLFLTPQALQTVEGYFAHYGAVTVAASRFIAGLRVVAALAAGTCGMHWLTFFIANLVGAIAWGVTMSLLGYYFGQSWELLHKWMGRGVLMIVGGVVVLVGLPYLLRRVRHLPAVSWDGLLRTRIWEGFVAALLVVICLAMLLVMAEHAAKQDRADEQVDAWVSARRGSPLDTVAVVASYLGSLPAATIVTALIFMWSWSAGQPMRERLFILWALAGSEAVGLVLLALIRHKGIEPQRALAWPFGFAGLAPLRATAVFGMVFQVTRRLLPARSVAAGIVAVCAIALTGFSVVWTQEQHMTEVILEYVAGGLVLFMGLWWLEGYSSGNLSRPTSEGDTATSVQSPSGV